MQLPAYHRVEISRIFWYSIPLSPRWKATFFMSLYDSIRPPCRDLRFIALRKLGMASFLKAVATASLSPLCTVHVLHFLELGLDHDVIVDQFWGYIQFCILFC
mmetsp:Transcript_17852/g.35977  ORF Transcript_17852/g.35977 Transcript_17852/m.35977 type:complete len:103 (+) Transcript_17852:820-1128(+)